MASSHRVRVAVATEPGPAAHAPASHTTEVYWFSRTFAAANADGTVSAPSLAPHAVVSHRYSTRSVPPSASVASIVGL